MIFQIIDRIVGRTYDFHVHTFHDCLGTELRCLQFGCAFVVYLAGGGRIQNLVYAEDTAQFKMGPVI